MIVAMAIASAVAVILASIWLSDRVVRWTMPRVKSPDLIAIAEKRRILERQRASWMVTCKDRSLPAYMTDTASTRVLDIDQDLLRLADEERKIR